MAQVSLYCVQIIERIASKPWLTAAPEFEKRILSDPLHVGELVEMSKTHVENGQNPNLPLKAARMQLKKRK